MFPMHWHIAVCIETCRRHVPTLWRYRFGRFDTTSFRNHFIIRGFSPWNGERFLFLGPMWNALVRGWRSDCVVGGMGTRFQWRKAHNLSAKCEAFHVAPRLFFMFLFLIPSTIRQQCIIHAPRNFPQNPLKSYLHRLLMPCVHQSNWSTLTANR